MKKIIKKEMFYYDLPTYETGVYKGNINWANSVGYRVNFIYYDIEGDVEILSYDKNYLWIKYLNKEPFRIQTGNFKKCQLGKLLDKKTSEFKIDIGTNFRDEKRDIIITYRTNIKDKNGQERKFYQYKCNKCGYDCKTHYRDGEYKEFHWISENNLLNGQGCSCCDGKIAVLGINTIWDTDRWMCDLGVSEEDAKKYTKGSNKNIFPICIECNRIRNKEISIATIWRTHSIACSCGDGKSYPEKLMFSVLEQLGVEFETEYSPDWIKPKRYDFYFELNNKKYIIETDGELGHGNRIHSRSNKTLKDTIKNDNYKDIKAKKRNIEVIRIRCLKSELEYIRDNILNDKRLNSLFDLSIIDWNKAESFALSNLVKQACEIKHYNENISTGDIAKIMRISDTTVRSYLKKGSKVGWVNYDPKIEKSKISSKNGKSTGKPVEIFKDGQSLGIFPSARELDRQSENLFGVRLSHNMVLKVCNQKLKHYKRFYFEHIDNSKAS